MCMLGGKCSQLEYYTNDLNNEHVPACLLWIKYIASYQDHSVASQIFPIGSSSATAIASSVRQTPVRLDFLMQPNYYYWGTTTPLLLIASWGPKVYLKFPYDHIFA